MEIRNTTTHTHTYPETHVRREYIETQTHKMSLIAPIVLNQIRQQKHNSEKSTKLIEQYIEIDDWGKYLYYYVSKYICDIQYSVIREAGECMPFFSR